jgi:flagellar protein FlaJ
MPESSTQHQDLVSMLRRLWKEYNLVFYRAKFSFYPQVWLLISTVLSAILAFISYLLLNHNLPLAILYFILLFIFFAIGVPYYLMARRLEQIEKSLPYFLSQLSSAVRSGMGIDSALNEIAKSLGGPLGEEIRKTFEEINKGIPISEAFQRAADRIGTKFVKRIFRILVTAMEQGGHLAEVLDEITDNVQEMISLRLEREASTTMPAMFIVAAGVIISPIVFGISITLYAMMYKQAVQLGFIRPNTGVTPEIYTNILLFYLALEGFLSALIVAKMRWGKVARGLIFAPLFAYLAPIIALASAHYMAGLLQSAASVGFVIL